MPRPRPAASRAGLADARRPAHLRLAGPQLMTERAALRLVLEQGNGHLNDHARTSRHASMMTAARMRTAPRRYRPRRGYPHRMRRPRWQRPGGGKPRSVSSAPRMKRSPRAAAGKPARPGAGISCGNARGRTLRSTYHAWQGPLSKAVLAMEVDPVCSAPVDAHGGPPLGAPSRHGVPASTLTRRHERRSRESREQRQNDEDYLQCAS